MKVFTITVNGKDRWVEPAGERVALELQHHMATVTYKGQSIRVRERYVQDSNPAPEKPETDSGGKRFNTLRIRN